MTSVGDFNSCALLLNICDVLRSEVGTREKALQIRTLVLDWRDIESPAEQADSAEALILRAQGRLA